MVNSRKIRWAAAIISCLLIMGIISALFVYQMNRTIENNTLSTIHELAEHDQTAIQTFVDSNWGELQGIQERLEVYKCESILEMQQRMNLERSTSGFHTIYLVAEDGTVYSDRYMVYPREEMDLMGYLEGGGSRIARRYDFSTTVEMQKEMLLYAVRMDGYQVEGVRFTAIVGLSSINQIQDNMRISSFVKNGESRGYSSVVNPNGDYIVNIKRTVSLNQQENLFEILENGQLERGWSIEEIVGKMEDKESFTFNFTDEEGVKKVIYCAPIENTFWYFLMVVESRVFSEQSFQFILMSAILLVGIVIVVVAMLLYAMFSRREMVKANAESKARSEFLSNMSHEIRTPLNGIVGLLYLIQNHIKREKRGELDGAQLSDWADKAYDTANYLLVLVSDILDMSKLQAGRLEVVKQPLIVSTMLDSVCSMQRSNIENRGITFVTRQELQEPCVLEDEVHIKQVLMNILGNAAKFTPAGGTITLSAWQEPAEAGWVRTVITCRDTGVGMSPEFLKTIWDSFSQERNQVSDGTRGTGLGMAISKGFIDAIGGKLTVESELGVGSEFRIELHSEIAQQAVPCTGGAAPAEERPGSDLITGKILVAEDNELNAEIIREILQEEGFQVVLAANGRIALEEFAASQPGEFSVILMDMQMPELDGCQAAERIRALDRPDARTIPIFACTANTFQEDQVRALASGMNDFLPKPIDVSVLLNKLKNQI